MTREEQEHYEKLAEHYNSKKDEIKPNPELWSIQDVAVALEKHGLLKRISDADILDRIKIDIINSDLDYPEIDLVFQIIDKYRSVE